MELLTGTGGRGPGSGTWQLARRAVVRQAARQAAAQPLSRVTEAKTLSLSEPPLSHE